MPPPRVRSSRPVYANPWMTVREDRIVRPDGSQGLYGVVERRDFALAVPWDGERLWLVEQWRHPVASLSLEFPQGGWDGEPEGDAAALARLELREETGFTAERLTPLGRLWQAVGASDQAFDAFLATGLRAGAPPPAPDEFGLRSLSMTPAEVLAAVAEGRIRDSATVAALWLLRAEGSVPLPAP